MRNRASQKRYIRASNGLKSKDCPFCHIKENEPREIHEETTYFYRIENIFGYDSWDGRAVEEHQLVVPKRHVTSLSELTDEEGREYLRLIQTAEANGYCLYTRGSEGPTKSIAHLHSHLIKLDFEREIKQYVFVRKPHIVWFHTSHK